MHPSTSQSVRVACSFVSLLGLLMAPTTGRAQVSAQLVNGLGELGEPTTIGLVQGTVPEDGFLACSGVLIGCDVAITTAHCFNVNASIKTHIYVPHAGFIPIESATRHPAYVDAITTFPPNWLDITREEDISFIKLAVPVTGVTPASIVAGAAPAPGTAGLIVGFGRDPVTEASFQNPGIKRSGTITLAACSAPALVGLDVLCWNPGNPFPSPGEDVTTCSGDSGGPLFSDEFGSRIVSGITKGAIFDPQGQPDLCLPPVSPYDTSVARHRSWIGGSDGAGGMVATTSAIPLSNKQCSLSAQLPETAPPSFACDSSPWSLAAPARYCGFEGVLGDMNPTQANYDFDVPAGTTTLRVALNGIASSLGVVDTDLYVRRGAPATTSTHDCSADGTGTLGFCDFDSPQPDTWHVLVDQPLAAGDHQVVVTLLGPAPPPGVPSLAPLARLLLLVAILAAPSLRRARTKPNSALV